MAVSRLLGQVNGIVELDLNPVMVGAQGEGCRVVDARAVTDDTAMPSERARLDLDRLLRPEHVVVVGVSDDEHKVGARLFRYLVEHGFAGRVDAVHPSGGSVRGHARLAQLRDVDGSPDLVLIAVPAAQVAEVARQAVEVAAGGVIVHSSGFAETGAEGRALQDEVVGILAESGIPLAGPNNMGIVVPSRRLAASISGGMELTGLVPGRVALMTSSGALGSCFATRLMSAGVGLSHWIHAGNEADRVVADYLEWLVDDEETGAVALIIEDIKDAPRFIAAGRALSAAGKPVFAYNMVRSEKGQAAALSHTGAMVGNLRIRQHVLASARMTEVPTLRVLEDVMLLGAADRLPAGPRLAVVTFSGGASTVIADELERGGVTLHGPSPETAAAVQAVLPSFAAVDNPLDVSYQVISEPEAFRDAMTLLLKGGSYDAALVQFTTNADPYAEHTAKAALAVREAADVPVYLSRYGAEAIAPRAVEVYRNAGVQVLDAPDRAAQAVAALLRAQETLSPR
jgi:acyl-CoA synthetase (NDP forming)